MFTKKKKNQSKLIGYFVELTVRRIRHDNNSDKIK